MPKTIVLDGVEYELVPVYEREWRPIVLTRKKSGRVRGYLLRPLDDNPKE